eukprot:718107_1
MGCAFQNARTVIDNVIPVSEDAIVPIDRLSKVHIRDWSGDLSQDHTVHNIFNDMENKYWQPPQSQQSPYIVFDMLLVRCNEIIIQLMRESSIPEEIICSYSPNTSLSYDGKFSLDKYTQKISVFPDTLLFRLQFHPHPPKRYCKVEFICSQNATGNGNSLMIQNVKTMCSESSNYNGLCKIDKYKWENPSMDAMLQFVDDYKELDEKYEPDVVNVTDNITIAKGNIMMELMSNDRTSTEIIFNVYDNQLNAIIVEFCVKPSDKCFDAILIWTTDANDNEKWNCIQFYNDIKSTIKFTDQMSDCIKYIKIKLGSKHGQFVKFECRNYTFAHIEKTKKSESNNSQNPFVCRIQSIEWYGKLGGSFVTYGNNIMNDEFIQCIVQKRIVQMVGVCKVFLQFQRRIRCDRASMRWRYGGRIASICAGSVCNHLRIARLNIFVRNNVDKVIYG